MKEQESEARWDRLIELLRPVHEQALATARRLCRQTADGDDLYQEAVLRAENMIRRAEDTLRSLASDQWPRKYQNTSIEIVLLQLQSCIKNHLHF